MTSIVCCNKYVTYQYLGKRLVMLGKVTDKGMAYPSGTGRLFACSACFSWFCAMSITQFIIPTSRAAHLSFFFLAICFFAFSVSELLR